MYKLKLSSNTYICHCYRTVKVYALKPRENVSVYTKLTSIWLFLHHPFLYLVCFWECYHWKLNEGNNSTGYGPLRQRPLFYPLHVQNISMLSEKCKAFHRNFILFWYRYLYVIDFLWTTCLYAKYQLPVRNLWK